jgi:hypothetical protein
MVRGLRLQQVADYVAMAGLVELHHDADFGGLPSILGLFEPRTSAGPVPSGLTDWDEAFLRSLYGTDQKYVMQRAQVAQGMLRDLKP